MSPAIGEQLTIPSGLPRNLETAISRYGNATYKAPVATVLDPNGKLSVTLTYGKYAIQMSTRLEPLWFYLSKFLNRLYYRQAAKSFAQNRLRPSHQIVQQKRWHQSQIRWSCGSSLPQQRPDKLSMCILRLFSGWYRSGTNWGTDYQERCGFSTNRVSSGKLCGSSGSNFRSLFERITQNYIRGGDTVQRLAEIDLVRYRTFDENPERLDTSTEVNENVSITYNLRKLCY